MEGHKSFCIHLIVIVLDTNSICVPEGLSRIANGYTFWRTKRRGKEHGVVCQTGDSVLSPGMGLEFKFYWLKVFPNKLSDDIVFIMSW